VAFSNLLEFCLPSLEVRARSSCFCASALWTLLVFASHRRLLKSKDTSSRSIWTGWLSVGPLRRIYATVCGWRRETWLRWLVGALQYLHMVAAQRLNADFYAVNTQCM